MMISALDKKLFRDLLHMRAQALAIVAVIAAGVAVFIAEFTTLASLTESRAAYYERQRFAEVFAVCKRAPKSLAARIEAIPGVNVVQVRTVAEVSLDVPGMDDPAVGQMISVPEDRRPALNDVHIRDGRYIAPDAPGEVLAGEEFMAAHKLKPGDNIAATINGRKRKLTLAGSALSPEYIYVVRAGEFLPDKKRFGVFWMGERELASAFNMEGAFNDVTLKLAHGANEPAVIAQLDALLKPYGGIGAQPRAKQTSHWYLENELSQLRALGLAMPLVFLGVAAFLLNVVLSRQIATQREQIAALKAFGYSNVAVGAHYLKLVLIIATIGGAVGVASGAYLATLLAQLYSEYYHFPKLLYVLPPGVIVAGVGLSTMACVSGAMISVRAAAKLPPAEAMRPAAPGNFRPTFVERMGLQRWISQPARMILRQLERRPARAMLSVAGIAMSAAIFVIGFFFVDTIEYVIDVQFFRVQREDMSVTLFQPRQRGALHEIARMPGVLAAEPFRVAPVTLRVGHRSRQVGITGLTADAALHRVLDAQLRPIVLPPDGIVLSTKLGEVMGVAAGDALTVEVSEGARLTRQTSVAFLSDDFLGLSAYMELGALNRLLREGDSMSGAYLRVDPRLRDSLYSRLKAAPSVAAVSMKDTAITSFRETLAQNMMTITLINSFFAGVIAFGVLFNSARIALSERARELASLRVLGMTRGEISYILLGEQAVLTLVALPIGIVLGWMGAWAFCKYLIESELIRFPLIVSERTSALAAVVILVSAAIAGISVRRKLNRLDLVEVLKARE
ncbi:MAG: FtsX-like permease family protein [Planctomycetes bacterium]|nr:FtsX-like permease family protein [Planctomycetota bacterium]